MKVSEIMTADVEVIRPESSVREAAQKMRSLNVGSLPVCDGERLLGVITDRDIAVRLAAEGLDPAATPVEQCMSAEVVWCFEDQSLEEAQRLMQEKQIRRLPVISHEKKLVGILALGDLAIKTDEVRQAGETLQEISEAAPA